MHFCTVFDPHFLLCLMPNRFFPLSFATYPDTTYTIRWVQRRRPTEKVSLPPSFFSPPKSSGSSFALPPILLARWLCNHPHPPITTYVHGQTDAYSFILTCFGHHRASYVRRFEAPMLKRGYPINTIPILHTVSLLPSSFLKVRCKSREERRPLLVSLLFNFPLSAPPPSRVSHLPPSHLRPSPSGSEAPSINPNCLPLSQKCHQPRKKKAFFISSQEFLPLPLSNVPCGGQPEGGKGKGKRSDRGTTERRRGGKCYPPC